MENIREILNKAKMANSSMKTTINSQEVVKTFFELLFENREQIEKANQIDVNNNNGFELNFEIIDNMKIEILKLEDQYRKVLYMNKDKKNNYIQGSEFDNIGTICLAYTGNTYSLIEIISKTILTHNSLIITSESDYMKATNELIIILVKRVLQAYEIDENLIQLFYTVEYEKLLSNIVSINKVIAIGDIDFQRRIKQVSKVPVISKGYDNFDIYVESLTNIEIIQYILKTNNNIVLYLKSGIEVEFEDVVEVQDVEEAIAQINFNTSGYSTAIFTDDTKTATLFLRDIKSENLYVNASPLLFRYNDINIKEFLVKKQMFYPNPLIEKSAENHFEFPSANALAQKIIQKKEIGKIKIINEEHYKKINEKDIEIETLKKQLKESQFIANKYINILKNSFICKLFYKSKIREAEKDTKLIS